LIKTAQTIYGLFLLASADIIREPEMARGTLAAKAATTPTPFSFAV